MIIQESHEDKPSVTLMGTTPPAKKDVYFNKHILRTLKRRSSFR